MAWHMMDQRTMQRRLLIAVALPIGLLALLAAIFLSLTGYLQRAAAWVDHTDQVLAQANRLQVLLIDQENGLRGYLLTGDATFLAPFRSADDAAGPVFDILRRLVADNPSQTQRLDAIHVGAVEWEGYTLAALPKNTGGASDVAALQQDQRRMEKLRDQLAEFIAVEVALREQRSLATKQATWIVIGSSLIVCLLLGGLLAVVASRFIASVARRYGQALAELQVHTDAIQDSARQFHALFTQAPLGIALSRDDRTLLVNVALASMLGYDSPAQLEGQPWSSVVAPPYHDEIHSRVAQLAEGAAPEGYEVAGLRKDGTVLPFYIRVVQIALPDGPALVTYFSDRSAQQRLEAQVRQMQKLESIGRLAGGIAHDFNNLLTALSGYAELARLELPRDHPVYHDLEAIQQVVDRATALTQQLLAFARKQPLELKVVDLNTLIGAMDALLRRLLGEHIDLRTLPAPNLGLVKVDPGQIEQVLVNLAVNARDAMPSGGQLTIETANVDLDAEYVQQHVQVAPGSYVMLAVSDTGTGISPEVQTRLFEPFFTTKEPERGTGLGLATSYGIVTQHGGYITVYSEVGQGTTFKVYLPLISQAPDIPPAEPAPQARPTGTETVLVVEDEPAVRALAVRVLQGAGYTALEAAAGDAALRIAQAHMGAIDLLLADVMLPQLSGVTLAAHLRWLRPELKTLFISGYGEQALVHQGRLDTDAQILPKPFAAATLLRAVRAVLDAIDGERES